MGFELPNGKTARNLQEQVKFLSEKLKDLYAAVNEIGIRVLVVAELPEEGEPLTIYFVPAEDASQENIYNEYMWVEDEWELIGSTEIDLSDYMTLSTDQTVSGTKSFALSDSQEYKGVITPLSSGFKLGTNVIDSLRFAGYGMYAMSKFLPEDNGTLDLGQNDLRWKDLYLSGTIFQTNYNVSWNNGIIINNSSDSTMFYIGSDKSCWIYGKLIPSGGNVDIGDGGHKIRNMYISNNITDGTNTVSITDLAALITYAKAQGWIS